MNIFEEQKVFSKNLKELRKSKMKFVEFFAGGRCFGRVAEAAGHEVISTDWTAYENIDI
jgi:adenine-specific DNA methylase